MKLDVERARLLRRLVALLALSTATVALSGCAGSGQKPASAGANDVGVTPRADAEVSVDVCALLTEVEVQRYLGAGGAGVPSGETACEWRNAATEESVTLSVYAAGTNVSGTLDPVSDYGNTEPLPELGESARYSPGGGIVEFIAGDRDCELQITVQDQDQRRRGAIALVTLARDRI
jgi:hypothetical protein